MGSKICMNERCRAKSSSEWKKGWTLKSGESAILCYDCGYSYENFKFCEAFHREEAGWRECRLCGKRIHCGCIASKNLHQCLDFGGVACSSCLKHFDSNSIKPAVQIPSYEIPNAPVNEIIPLIPTYEKANLLQMPNRMDLNRNMHLFTSQNDESHTFLAHMPRRETILGETDACFTSFLQQSSGSSMFIKPVDHSRQKDGVKDVYEAPSSINFLLDNPLSTSGSNVPFVDDVVEGTLPNKVCSFQQEQKANHTSLKPTKASSSSGSELNKGTEAQERVARPPADAKGRSQLLPRYWPRITDKELQQLSEDLKSTVVPLFEKILSASDAGRIGRLVLPKACAEAYFPTINQSDGLPIRVQDVKGKEWTFQFRFWPNNNSRMYVLEGVTPCIQNLQLQAGDTVTFSRIDHGGGKFVIGFRKATNNADSQDPQAHALVLSGEALFPGVDDNMIQNGHRTSEESLQHVSTQEKKKARNIGSKNKRLLMHNDDAMELRLTWEETQELLRPPPTIKPTTVMIEDCEFEEYDEPPIFGKKTVFTDHPSGDQAQWVQCDLCKKWRKLPVDILLPAKWTCANNVWDANRYSCSAPDEMIPWEIDTFNKTSTDSKRRRLVENKITEDCAPSGLDALATAAVLGDNIASLGERSDVTTTTKHPRHRSGCSCIVCIQPPSGKGKHPSTCICSVCDTVKRRYQTLMLRRKRKQSEREAEIAHQNDRASSIDAAAETETMVGQMLLQMNPSEGETTQNGDTTDIPDSSIGQLDLNCQPSREDDMLAEAATGLNMNSLINAASPPLYMYLKKNEVDRSSNSLLSNDAENDFRRAGEAEEAETEEKTDKEIS